MTAGRRPFRASRMSAQEFTISNDAAATARRSAERIIAEARATATAMTADLEQREAEMNMRIKNMTDAQLRTFIDEQSLTQSARSMASLLSEAQRIRIAFEDMQPWLVALVETCLRKIAGKIDADALIANIVAEAVSDMRSHHALILHVATKDRARIQAIAADWPDAFAAVDNILPDAALPAGEMTLEGAEGLISFGLSSSITAVIDNLERALIEQNDCAGNV